MKSLFSVVINKPIIVSCFLILLVIAHILLSARYPHLDIASALVRADPEKPHPTLSSLALGFATVGAMVGGFAGVVVIFGLGTENDRFRLLRRQGSRRLRANWVSVVLSSFASAFGAVLSAVTILGFSGVAGLWILELCLFIAMHGAIRLTALLSGLAKVVDGNDRNLDTPREGGCHKISFNDLNPRKNDE